MTTLVKRTTQLPAAYAAMPWVRSVHPRCCDCDAEEDQRVLESYKAILNGEKDVREFDSEHEFILAMRIPDSVKSANGSTWKDITVETLKWNVTDVVFLIEGTMPVHHPSIRDCGFSEQDLLRLANPSHSAVEYIRCLETYSGRRKGLLLSAKAQEEFIKFEKKVAAKARLFQKRDQLTDFHRASNNTGDAVRETDRNEVFKDHDYSCLFCGKSRPEVTLNAHHVIPRSIIKKLQLDDLLYTCRWNLVCACKGCNGAKSDTLAPEDLRFLIEQIEADELKKNQKLLPHLRQFQALQKDRDR